MTPWLAGIGLLVSFTATAGTDGGLRLSMAPGPAGPGLILATRPDDAIGPLLAAARNGPGATRAKAGGALVFAGLPGEATPFIPGPATWSPDLEPDGGFIPVPDLGLEGTVREALTDGSTPAVPRAVALSSVTPAPADAIPVEVAAASLVLPALTGRGESPAAAILDGARHRYADLIDPEKMDREQRCLAEAVYFEARSEPEEGQAAVAQVVLNRVKSGLYPGNVCGVVYQNRHRYMGCQFSFACEGKSLRITDSGSWQTATRIAGAVIQGKTYLSDVGGATHYHADYVRPGWSRRLRRMDVIGRHIFYQLKRGQT